MRTEGTVVRNDRARTNFSRFLYTQNPFYLLSCGLILFGVQYCFKERGRETLAQIGIELASGFDFGFASIALACYAILMTFTAIVIIRFGKVWDDARSILVVVVLK